jgi:adenylate cyclase
MDQDRTKRRLAAILVADRVGYSRLMEADEASTLASLRNCRTTVLEPTMRVHGGRLVKVMGDGVLIEFASAVNAVAGATEANEGMPDNQRIILRIGINLGDVIGVRFVPKSGNASAVAQRRANARIRNMPA